MLSIKSARLPFAAISNLVNRLRPSFLCFSLFNLGQMHSTLALSSSHPHQHTDKPRHTPSGDTALQSKLVSEDLKAISSLSSTMSVLKTVQTKVWVIAPFMEMSIRGPDKSSSIHLIPSPLGQPAHLRRYKADFDPWSNPDKLSPWVFVAGYASFYFALPMTFTEPIGVAVGCRRGPTSSSALKTHRPDTIIAATSVILFPSMQRCAG